jgi:outer membrane receptor protein involved in Fe transport
LNLTYTHAALSAPMPSYSTAVGNRGDRLPYIPLWTGSLTADYSHVLRNGWTATLGVGAHYTGQRYVTIDNPGNCTLCPTVPSLRPYGALDAHAGISNDPWNVHLNVRNLTNKYSLVDMTFGGGPTYDLPPVVATTLSGRLFTLGVDRRF